MLSLFAFLAFVMICLTCGALILTPIKLRLRIYEALPAAGLIGLVLNLGTLYAACVWRGKLDHTAIYSGWGMALLLALLLAAWPLHKALQRQGLLERWHSLQAIGWRGLLRSEPELLPVGLMLLGWGLLLSLAFNQVLVFTSDGVRSVVGFDLPVHMAMIHAFLEQEAVPLQNPFFAGRPLLYPFMINLLSAMLMKLGLSLPQALIFPGVLLCLSLLSLLYGMTLRLSESRAAALLAPAVLLCNGGMGWVYFVIELSQHGFNPLLTLYQQGHNYTDLPEYGLQWFNFMRYFLLPQRSSLLGLPLILLVALLRASFHLMQGAMIRVSALLIIVSWGTCIFSFLFCETEH
ncbi:MAG: hypothetical protein CVV27_16885 [Candidatus Melainabacteria bacterium HGW-Melainabacteria-1]|nr:MAG: hypothetical protein CVV27_16885 [Candidatus Melainabacteria bacterium HGW-Melainabacteria-1]